MQVPDFAREPLFGCRAHGGRHAFCACASGWTLSDWIQNQIARTSCLSELLKRVDQHRSKVAKALTRCEVGVLTGRLSLPSGGSCAADDQKTAKAIASSRDLTTTSIMSRCPASALSEIYATDGPEAAATFVKGLLLDAEVPRRAPRSGSLFARHSSPPDAHCDLDSPARCPLGAARAPAPTSHRRRKTATLYQS